LINQLSFSPAYLNHFLQGIAWYSLSNLSQHDPTFRATTKALILFNPPFPGGFQDSGNNKYQKRAKPVRLQFPEPTWAVSATATIGPFVDMKDHQATIVA
jgi:hypothetical protein